MIISRPFVPKRAWEILNKFQQSKRADCNREIWTCSSWSKGRFNRSLLEKSWCFWVFEIFFSLKIFILDRQCIHVIQNEKNCSLSPLSFSHPVSVSVMRTSDCFLAATCVYMLKINLFGNLMVTLLLFLWHTDSSWKSDIHMGSYFWGWSSLDSIVLE